MTAQEKVIFKYSDCIGRTVQSNLSYVTFQGIIEIWSHKTGGHLIQVYLI
jgi:hypothetical protein